jgi:hypothetical protein
MNVLSHESLWQKAKLYARRATAASRDDPTFGLWATIALEFLARSTIARVHPVLVADPQEPQYLLYAFGFRTDRSPRTIAAKAVFARCQAIVPGFTDTERTFAMTLIERRNAELHSGSPAFHGIPSSEWLAEYYRVCDILLKGQGRGLGHLFGGDEAKTARKLIRAAESNVKSKVLSELARLGNEFRALPRAQRKKLAAEGRKRAELSATSRALATRVRCPSCNSWGVQWGQRVRTGEPIAEEDIILIKSVVLPTKFECVACGLTLTSHGELHFAGIGDRFTVDEYIDPRDYYGLVHPSEMEESWEYDEYFNE